MTVTKARQKNIKTYRQKNVAMRGGMKRKSLKTFSKFWVKKERSSELLPADKHSKKISKHAKKTADFFNVSVGKLNMTQYKKFFPKILN